MWRRGSTEEEEAYRVEGGLQRMSRPAEEEEACGEGGDLRSRPLEEELQRRKSPPEEEEPCRGDGCLQRRRYNSAVFLCSFKGPSTLELS